MLLCIWLFWVLGKYYPAKRYWCCSMHEFFSSSSLHEFYNDFVDDFPLQNISIVLIIAIFSILTLCNTRDLQISWNEKYLPQLTFILACLLTFASSPNRGYIIWSRPYVKKYAKQQGMYMDTTLADHRIIYIEHEKIGCTIFHLTWLPHE